MPSFSGHCIIRVTPGIGDRSLVEYRKAYAPIPLVVRAPNGNRDLYIKSLALGGRPAVPNMMVEPGIMYRGGGSLAPGSIVDGKPWRRVPWVPLVSADGEPVPQIDLDAVALSLMTPVEG